MENTHLWKQLESFYGHKCENGFLFFKTNTVTQVFITDIQVKA